MILSPPKAITWYTDGHRAYQALEATPREYLAVQYQVTGRRPDVLLPVYFLNFHLWDAKAPYSYFTSTAPTSVITLRSALTATSMPSAPLCPVLCPAILRCGSNVRKP